MDVLALVLSVIALAVSVKALLAMKRLEAMHYTPTFSYARPLEGLSEEEKQRLWEAVQEGMRKDALTRTGNQYAFEPRYYDPLP